MKIQQTPLKTASGCQIKPSHYPIYANGYDSLSLVSKKLIVIATS
jgi:hypothetical protein